MNDENPNASDLNAIGEARAGLGPRNVFRDVNQEDADVVLVKATLVVEIQRLLRRGVLERRQVVEAFGIDDSALDELLRGRTKPYTIDGMVRALADLGYRIEICIVTDDARPNLSHPSSLA